MKQHTEQHTIKRTVHVRGVNVYNGRSNHVWFHPADENSGLVFLVKGKYLPAHLENASNRRKAISLNDGTTSARLVEHVLSAAYALGIDNMVIELSDGVCPTLDDCAHTFATRLQDELVPQSASRKYWTFAQKAPCTIDHYLHGKPDKLSIGPTDGFIIDYHAHYSYRAIGHQRLSVDMDSLQYHELASARPIGFAPATVMNIVCSLEGLGLHGITKDNTLWVNGRDSADYANRTAWDEKYRGTEFVRHKVLDVLGTLALTGRQFHNTAFAFDMTGHAFDIYALHRAFSEGAFKDYAPS